VPLYAYDSGSSEHMEARSWVERTFSDGNAGKIAPADCSSIPPDHDHGIYRARTPLVSMQRTEPSTEPLAFCRETQQDPDAKQQKVAIIEDTFAEPCALQYFN